MIRQPIPEERMQMIPLIQTIMKDMELPILKEISPSTLHAMLKEAMLHEDFRYSLTNSLVYIEDLAKQQGASVIALNCEEINDKAYQLYQKLGYTATSTKILSGHSYYHMTKKLE